MVTGVEAVTVVVLTVNVSLVYPAITVTLDGTVAAGALLERLTTAPPLGAVPLRVTVPVDVDPPLTLVGLSASVDDLTEPEPGGVLVSPQGLPSRERVSTP